MMFDASSGVNTLVRDGTTGAEAYRSERHSSVLRVFRRLGRFPGARLMLESPSGRHLAVTDVRAFELVGLAEVLLALAEELGDDADRRDPEERPRLRRHDARRPR